LLPGLGDVSLAVNGTCGGGSAALAETLYYDMDFLREQAREVILCTLSIGLTWTT